MDVANGEILVARADAYLELREAEVFVKYTARQFVQAHDSGLWPPPDERDGVIRREDP